VLTHLSLSPTLEDDAMTRRQIQWLMVFRVISVLLNLLRETIFVLQELSRQLVELENEETK